MGIKEEIAERIKEAKELYEEAERGLKILERAGESVVSEKSELDAIKRKIKAYETALREVE